MTQDVLMPMLISKHQGSLDAVVDETGAAASVRIL